MLKGQFTVRSFLCYMFPMSPDITSAKAVKSELKETFQNLCLPCFPDSMSESRLTFSSFCNTDSVNPHWLLQSTCSFRSSMPGWPKDKPATLQAGETWGEDTACFFFPPWCATRLLWIGGSQQKTLCLYSESNPKYYNKKYLLSTIGHYN